MNLRLLFGGSVASSLRELTRDLAGVRVGRRGDSSVEAILAANGAMVAVFAVRCRKWWCYKLQVGEGKASLWSVAAQVLCSSRMTLCGLDGNEVNVPNSKATMRRRPRVIECARCGDDVVLFPSAGLAVTLSCREAAVE